MGTGSIWDVVDITQEKEKDEIANKYFEDFTDDMFEECKAQAATGDIEAQCLLGICYLIGLKVDRNASLGYKLVKAAADQNFAPGEFWVAFCYKMGLCVEKNEQQALYWLERSARNGYDQAQFSFARQIEDGNVSNQQPFQWYKMAAEQGHAGAQNNLGWLYQNAYGGAPRSGSDAFYWYEKSAMQGIAEAQNNLGYCYYNGLGVEKNNEKAIEWYEKAAAQGYPAAKESLDYLKNGGGGGFCFITTATCRALNKGDDCYELQMFRKFRDEWLLKQIDGKDIIAEYYRIAPKIVHAIGMQTDALAIYKNIWECYLSKCLAMIENNQNNECKETYMAMVKNLKDRFCAL